MIDPKITNRRVCLMQSDVDLSQLMNQFDRLPKRVREAIANSPFQLCVACIAPSAHNKGVEYALENIRWMEEMVRAHERR